MPLHARRAVTLPEVIIVMAIFAFLMAMVNQVTLDSKRFIEADAARDDLEVAGRRALQVIVNDLSNSAWFYDWNDADGDGEVDPTETVFLRMPWVNPPWLEGSVTIPDGSQNYATGTAVTGPPVVNASRGDRLAFFRLQAAVQPISDPRSQSPQLINFNDTTQAPVRMSQYVYGRPVPGLVLNETAAAGTDTNFVTQKWESDLANTFAENRQQSRLRCYAYAVQRSTRTSTGRLVRLYRNSGAWVSPLQASQFTVERELCDWVDNLEFDTVQTSSSLNTNQIRIALTLRQPMDDGSGNQVLRRFEATVAMRSLTQAE